MGGRSWVYSRQGGRELVARWAIDPADAVRLRARQESYWKGTWTVELDGTTVEVVTASMWKGTRRYLAGGRQLAESGTTGAWSSRPTLTAQPELAVDHAVFLLWGELVLGRRAAAVAAAV